MGLDILERKKRRDIFYVSWSQVENLKGGRLELFFFSFKKCPIGEKQKPMVR